MLVDEADLWPEGEFVTTHLIVGTEFLEEHPDIVRDLLSGQVDAIEFANDDPAEAQAVTNAGIEAITPSALPAEIIAAAWENLTFTATRSPRRWSRSAEDAEAVGLLDPVDLDGIYDLELLNEVLADRELDEVQEST